MMASVTALEPFAVDVPQDVLTDLAVPERPVTVPTGVANYPGELIRSLRPHAKRFFNVVALERTSARRALPGDGGA
jgi:hypothetical protein